ncbi:MAG: hypothetical protein RMJ66_02760 [Bacteroidia bacterium]|nr:hypothetical protein [Bacteroidia bacterium]MDW8133967.1 hypothetical protein [Bacteroidia bacterium]
MATVWLEKCSPLEGWIELPYSKSLSNRQIILGAHTGRPFSIKGLSEAADTQHLIEALQKCGYTIEKEEEKFLFIPPHKWHEKVQLYLGEGGTTLRFILPWLARLPTRVQLDVGSSLRRRPILPLLKCLQEAGANILLSSDSQVFPLCLQGSPQWQPSSFRIDSTLSSQFVSSLFLMAPSLLEGTCIEDLAKQPATPSYREFTRNFVAAYGWHWQRTETGWYLSSGNSCPSPLHFAGERDWSAASFFFGWASITEAHFEIPLQQGTLQPEKELFTSDLLPYSLDLNAPIPRVKSSGEAPSLLDVSVENYPDAALVLAVIGIFASGPSRLRGIHTLPHKESNRLEALARELQKVGAQLYWEEDVLYIFPCEHLPNQSILFDSYGDHRVAMALSLIAGRSSYPVGICQAECVAKSFPTYWKVLANVGVKCTFVP